MTPREAAAKLLGLRIELEEAAAAGVRVAADIIAAEAKEWIGSYHAEWPPLSELTEQEKARLGYDKGPLERTSEMKESIHVEQEGLQARVGTDLEYAVYQEHGTQHIPPRPFLTSAMAVKADEAMVAIETAIRRVLTGR